MSIGISGDDLSPCFPSCHLIYLKQVEKSVQLQNEGEGGIEEFSAFTHSDVFFLEKNS